MFMGLGPEHGNPMDRFRIQMQKNSEFKIQNSDLGIVLPQSFFDDLANTSHGRVANSQQHCDFRAHVIPEA